MSNETMAEMNWSLVEDAKEAMSRGDWMLALSLFEQSRRICINEGWHDGVHYADDMILRIYPKVKRQIDDQSNIVAYQPVDKESSQDEQPDSHHDKYYREGSSGHGDSEENVNKTSRHHFT
jgi:hypothetical protein